MQNKERHLQHEVKTDLIHLPFPPSQDFAKLHKQLSEKFPRSEYVSL